MRMSPGVTWGRRSLTVVSTTAAGTISQIARGPSSFFTRSAIDEAPTAFARVSSSTAFGDASKTTHSWPPARSRRAMLAPMRPSPIIPSCTLDSFDAPIARRGRFRPPADSGPHAGVSARWPYRRGRRRLPSPPPARWRRPPRPAALSSRRRPHPLPRRTQAWAARSARAPVRPSAESPSGGLGSLEDVHELAVSTRDLGDGVFACAVLGPPLDERLPEVRPPDGEADEPGDAGCRREPLAHLLVVLAPSQDNAAHPGPATPARGGHDPLAVLAPVEPFDLPDVRLDLGILELLDRLDHQPRTEHGIVGLRVPMEAVELRAVRGH